MPQLLKPFDTMTDTPQVWVDLQIFKDSGDLLSLDFSFRLVDPSLQVKWPQMQSRATDWPRQDGLWHHTCFEIFLQPTGSTEYLELNFSPKGAWAQYHFESYRSPQPPVSSDLFKLNRAICHEPSHTLSGQLQLSSLQKNWNSAKALNIGMTAVLEKQTGEKLYLALTHSGNKPDFHLNSSFTLIKEI